MRTRFRLSLANRKQNHCTSTDGWTFGLNLESPRSLLRLINTEAVAD